MNAGDVFEAAHTGKHTDVDKSVATVASTCESVATTHTDEAAELTKPLLAP